MTFRFRRITPTPCACSLPGCTAGNIKPFTSAQGLMPLADALHLAERYNLVQTQAAADVLTERQRQQEIGHVTTKDDRYANQELVQAAQCYCQAGLATLSKRTPHNWPWRHGTYKPKDRRTNLVRAAALLLAEVERMDRAKEK